MASPGGERSEASAFPEQVASRDVLDALSDAVFLAKEDGTIVDANATARDWFSLPENGAVDPPDAMRDAMAAIVEETLETAQGQAREERVAIGDRERIVKMVGSPLASEAVLVSLRDVTEMKAKIDAALHQERVLEEAQAIADIGSWTWDVREDEVSWSDELYRIFGRDPDRFNGTFEGYLSSIHPDDLGYVQRVIEEGQSSGEAFSFEHRIVRPDDEGRMLHCRGQVITDPDGEPLRMVGTAQDITERYEAEERLREYATQLQQANRELEHFAHVASHDLKEPLRMVTSYVQLLEEHLSEQLEEDAREYMEFVQNGTRRMHRLIQDLLAYSRVGQSDPEFQPMDLGSVLAEVKINLEPLIQETDANLSSDALPTITGDEAQISLLLQNLVSNAIKFHADDQTPHVQVRARDEKDAWHLLIIDDGIGFDPGYQDRIFRMFQRLHTEEAYPGSGIGLAICKTIVDAHGGKIWAESEPGEGTTFHIELPKEPSAKETDPREALERAREELADAAPG